MCDKTIGVYLNVIFNLVFNVPIIVTNIFIALRGFEHC